MGDVPVSEVGLDCPGVVSLVGEVVAAGVAQHVGVDGQADSRKPRQLAGTRHDLSDGDRRERRASFTHEHESITAAGSVQRPERPHFVPGEWMHRGDAVLEACDMEPRPRKINLAPLQPYRFRDPQRVAVHEQEQCPVTGAVPAAVPRRVDHGGGLVGC